MDYKIEEFPNTELIDIHLSKRLAQEDYKNFFDARFALDKLSSKDAKLKDLAGALFLIPGVAKIDIHQYSIRIHKAPHFEWKDMEPEIVKTINVMLAPEEEMKELPRIAMTEEERVRILAKSEETNTEFFGGPLFW